MLMRVFRVMKTTYALLDPQNEPRAVNAGTHIAVLGYADSDVFIHFGLSTETSTRFSLILRDMQIEDKVENLPITVPLELARTVADDYRWSESDLARRVQKYYERLVNQGLIESIDSPYSPQCDICHSWLVHCACCQIAKCPSECDGYSLPTWRTCAIGSYFFSFSDICAECANGGATCMCQAVWTCHSVRIAHTLMSVSTAEARASATTALKKNQKM
ncbi:hypothetical protein DFH29DRAFT_900351 [Suillus ampliporus]|nr:hypothetical protein DFH29DRAFT_900351 [Suillus ampliporus]